MKTAMNEPMIHPRTTDPRNADRLDRSDRFARGVLVAAIFTLGLAACGEGADDVTGTVPQDTTIEETQPIEPVTPTQ